MKTDSQTAMTQVTEVDAIREILAKQGSLSVDVQTLDEETDLYTVGLTSLATVGIMLALEDRFDVELPESMLSRTTFRSIATMAEAVAKLSH
jgi:acyl carrier protein